MWPAIAFALGFACCFALLHIAAVGTDPQSQM